MKPEPVPGVAYLKTEDPTLIDAANRHQFEIFSEYGYPGEGPYIDEVARYPSLYYVAVLEGQVVGCVRIVTKSPLGFPTATWLKLNPNWEEKVREIADNVATEEILFSTVRKGYRRLGNASIILNLYRILFQDATRRGVEYWFTTIDEKLLPYFTMVFNFKFVPMGEAQDYLGAPAIPTVMNVRQGLEELSAADPELAEFMSS